MGRTCGRPAGCDGDYSNRTANENQTWLSLPDENHRTTSIVARVAAVQLRFRYL
jgi:hypothetical protein